MLSCTILNQFCANRRWGFNKKKKKKKKKKKRSSINAKASYQALETNICPNFIAIGSLFLLLELDGLDDVFESKFKRLVRDARDVTLRHGLHREFRHGSVGCLA